jgi:hypothetical protein
MPLDPQDKQRLVDAYDNHMHALNAFDGMGPCDGPTTSNESRYFTTEARLERVADEIGVGPEHYDELEQMLNERDLDDGMSIGG